MWMEVEGKKPSWQCLYFDFVDRRDSRQWMRSWRILIHRFETGSRLSTKKIRTSRHVPGIDQFNRPVSFSLSCISLTSKKLGGCRRGVVMVLYWWRKLSTPGKNQQSSSPTTIFARLRKRSLCESAKPSCHNTLSFSSFFNYQKKKKSFLVTHHMRLCLSMMLWFSIWGFQVSSHSFQCSGSHLCLLLYADSKKTMVVDEWKMKLSFFVPQPSNKLWISFSSADVALHIWGVV